MDLDFLERLIRTVDESGIDSIEIERGGTRIRVAKSPTGTVMAGPPQGSYYAAPPSAPAPSPGGVTEAASADSAPLPEAAPKLREITSPMVGTFYRSPNPEAPPYVEVGSSVGKGDTLCIIEAMKLMNELEAEVEGVIAEICVENGDPVEYGQVLFRLEAS
ncbi:MAG: acetyl-CoA carboxylase biotin carboxyl carrier protein [Gemmatimonadota bacterium]